ncbi:MAG TPA: hypothetical protein VFW94_23450 [Candidatus Acidoferrales bacterium]|nr:hypothetical protein [Candidatus Acidoferrales bacterium]
MKTTPEQRAQWLESVGYDKEIHPSVHVIGGWLRDTLDDLEATGRELAEQRERAEVAEEALLISHGYGGIAAEQRSKKLLAEARARIASRKEQKDGMS